MPSNNFYKTETISLSRISVNQFQLLGATCLFLASKFKAFNNIRSETMVEYTDNLYTSRELKVGKKK